MYRSCKEVVPGAKFGMLTILERLPKKDGDYYRVRCRCDCGNETTPEITTVAKGITASCGCQQTVAINAISRMKSITSVGTGRVIPGARFGRLVVVRRIEKDGLLTDKIHCNCDCGNETFSEIDALIRGNTKSCGCLQSELLTKRNKDTAKHGGFTVKMPRTYNCWFSMMSRCRNPNTLIYANYGAKGVLVCDGLGSDPRNLVKLIGKRPSRIYTIDRFPIYNGNYTCGCCDECREKGWSQNIRWATPR